MRTAFPCLTAEVTNDSVFFKQAKVVHLEPLCIWFTFYPMLLFSSQGNFCMFYLFKLSGVTSGKLREDFTVTILTFSVFTLEDLQSEQSVSLFLHYSLKVFHAKIKKNPFFHFPFNSTELFHRIYSFSVKLFISCFSLSVMTSYGCL